MAIHIRRRELIVAVGGAAAPRGVRARAHAAHRRALAVACEPIRKHIAVGKPCFCLPEIRALQDLTGHPPSLTSRVHLNSALCRNFPGAIG
jgi:hypothetical protein